jgi:DNA adenine methylase
MKNIKIKTPITYYGGKQTMLKPIRPLIPPHSIYTEAFAGGVAVFWDKEPSAVEVLNDLNGELINFYRVLRLDYDALKTEIEVTIHSRGQHRHAWYIYNNPDFFSKIQRAWAVWVSSKLGFAGQFGSGFGFDRDKARHPLKITNAKQQIDDSLCHRLEGVTIDCDDALSVILPYDTADTWHFIDPPYIGANMGHYSGMFNEQNLVELLDMLTTIKGKFMLTMYPNDIIKQYVDNHGWQIHAIERQVSACKAANRRKQEEWMVVNYVV